jgi:WhiB family transcriptional regulator, redox-sensing transcriptional regulator
VDETSWLDRARCRGTDPERFFVRGAAQAKPAVRLCQACPVREECLDYALTNDIDFGVWGGLTERQRRSLQRRQRQFAAAG